MVQLSPDNGRGGWDWTSGYHYSDNTIAGFSHMHLSGTGIGDWLDISVMPLLAPLKGPDSLLIPATFSHQNEQASPGYYRVTLDNGIAAELTVSERVGFSSRLRAGCPIRPGFPSELGPACRNLYKESQ